MNGSLLWRGMLLARTVRHLRPGQVAHRVRLRGQRGLTARFPAAVASLVARGIPADGGWPAGFVPLDGRPAEAFPDPESNAAGEFRFLNETRRLGTPHDWNQSGASQLWRYHLHYFEWAYPLAVHHDRDWALRAFATLWRSWRAASPFGRGDAWSPYVASLRAWAFCGLHDTLVRGTSLEPDYVACLRLHAGFVRANLEADVGGNHLVKNLKALVGLGVFFADEGLLRRGLRRLERELPVQVLADGGHYERSPSYHCQVLGDLIDVRDLLSAAGRRPPAAIEEAIAAMQRWLGVMLLPDGDVPLFNDCTLVGHDRLARLGPIEPPPKRLTVLQPSGYVVARPDGRIHLVADVGPPCPPDLPAHAHADCLSFELAVDGRRVVVDTGTSTYQDATRRAYERSTAAHNTVCIDGADQTEVWGAFRAARRAVPRLEAAHDDGTTIVVAGSHDGYERLPGRPRHRRTWRVGAGNVGIVDEINGSGQHHAVSRFHMVSTAPPSPSSDGVCIGPLVVTSPDGLALDEAHVASGFGVTKPASVLTMRATGELPLRLSVDFQVTKEPG